MAHFAQIDDNNIVVQVLVVDNSQEHRGQEFLSDDLGLGGIWVQTSYNNNFRKQFAGVGFAYDPVADVFVQPQPFASWVLDANYDWQPPWPAPQNIPCYWDESIVGWVEIDESNLPPRPEADA